jgi:hypothetical protein
MSSPQPLVVLAVGTVVVVGLWLLMKPKRHEKFANPQKMSDFSRPCLLDSNAGFGSNWRSGANYVFDPKKNPHYEADPLDETIPLDMMGKGLQLLPPYVPMLTGGQYTPGCGDQVDTMPNDYPTRQSMHQTGNLDFIRKMNSTREDGVYGDYMTTYRLG